MHNQLFEGKLIHLAAPDPECDAEVESQWTHNAEFMRTTYAEPMRPLSPTLIKKKYAEAEKESGPVTNHFHFAIRTLAEDRLIGFAKLLRVEWTNGTVRLLLGIADASERGKGFGTEALRLILNYCFRELNLYRVSVSVMEYNDRAIKFFERAGFQVEVRRRQVIHRDNQRWDMIMLGLLREEWRGE